MLERLDQQLFLYLNGFHSPFWDQVMHAFSLILIWVPLYLLILIYLGFKYRRKFLIILLFLIIAVTLSDQVSVQLFKNIFHRLRPCHEPSLQGLVHLFNGQCGGMYGFISSHATNCFNVAVFSSSLVGKRWYTIFMLIWATVISYSRIYLGVHYPGDVICGAATGVLIGWGMYSLYLLTDRRILRTKTYFESGNQVTL
jgi:undecaprenyl-diphosphatase